MASKKAMQARLIDIAGDSFEGFSVKELQGIIACHHARKRAVELGYTWSVQTKGDRLIVQPKGYRGLYKK